MGERTIDPRQQFSKWLARWTSIFWFLYMTYLTTIMCMRPVVADACVYMAIIVSAVMGLSVGAYTKNSIWEKALLAGIQTEKLKLTWKPIKNTTSSTEEDTESGEG